MTWAATDLGLLPGGNFSAAFAASADGSVIVGSADTGDFNPHAFRWTAGGGMVDLGLLSGGTISQATAVSADGSIVAGQSDGGASADGNTEAFVWTSGGGMVGLGFLGTGTGSQAQAVSSDGTVVTGTSSIVPGSVFGLPTFPFTWTSGGGMVNRGLLSGNTDGIGQAASADGATIVGGSNVPSDVPWLWTSGGGVVAIPLFSGEVSGAALAVAADGLSATGFSNSSLTTAPHAFLWTQAGGTVLIGFLSGDASTGTGMSADGMIVVGTSGTFLSEQDAFYWTSAGGFVALPAAMGGSQPIALGISGNGQRPVGSSVIGGASHAVYWSQSETDSVTLSDTWLGVTPGFVDLTLVSNRRKFISAGGGAQDLGSDGSAPFGAAPVVFLTRTTTPATFAANSGRGGAFVIANGTLAAGADAPLATSRTVTVGATFSPGQGVLGDYRNGNLYAFNPATLTDNGSQRKWIRRWRALPQATVASVRFSYLSVAMESGVGVPPDTNPQVMLRWSDDGGRSWSNYRLLPAGRAGQTAFTVKFNRLGSTRRFAGADRVFELSSTDQFQVAILDAETEVS